MSDTSQGSPQASSSAEQALIDARRQKATRLRERGDNPFANDVVPKTAGAVTIDIADLRTSAAGGTGEGG